jgi:hypothetical protein
MRKEYIITFEVNNLLVWLKEASFSLLALEKYFSHPYNNILAWW